jgi:hypothetical protein
LDLIQALINRFAERIKAGPAKTVSLPDFFYKRPIPMPMQNYFLSNALSLCGSKGFTADGLAAPVPSGPTELCAPLLSCAALSDVLEFVVQPTSAMAPTSMANNKILIPAC